MKNLLFLLKPWFVFFIFLGISIRYYLRPTNIYFVDNYLNDILSTPILFQLCVVCLSLLTKREPQPLNHAQLIFGWLNISFYFELLFPLIKDSATADFMDVIAYLAGTILFYYIQKRMFSLKANRVN